MILLNGTRQWRLWKVYWTLLHARKEEESSDIMHCKDQLFATKAKQQKLTDFEVNRCSD